MIDFICFLITLASMFSIGLAIGQRLDK